MENINRTCTYLFSSLTIRISGVLFIATLLPFLAFASHGQMPEIDNGVSWLLAKENPSGSWGDANLTEFRDTTVVADVLKKLREVGAGYTNAISFINSVAPGNNDYVARKAYILAQEAIDVSSTIDALLSAQNPDELDNTLPNCPEGGWGAAAGYSTDCLDTALVLDALIYTPIPKGLLVSNKSIAAGETQDFYFDYPADAADREILISEVSGNITFRLFPDDSSGYYSWGPISSATYLNTAGITIDPGTRRVQIYGNSASTYFFKITLASGGYNSSSLINPLAYLIAAQNPDGGWGISKGSDSNVYLTSRVLLTLEAYANHFDLGTAIANGIAWLKTQQNPDGGFGAEGSSAYETALAYIAMANVDLSSTEAQNALNHVNTSQQANGSWNDNAYDTAVSLWALWTSLREIDTDTDGTPDILDNCPDVPNSDQKNTDGDLWGDACDEDDDNDGLLDTYEQGVTGTNPLLADSDGDGISDGDEDMDFDGLSNAEELTRGTDPKAPDVHLSIGLNLFGYPVEVPAGYTSYDLIVDLGTEAEVEKIQRYDPVTGTFETTTYESGAPSGEEFSILSGEGYLVYMKQAKSLSFPGAIACPTFNLMPGFNLVSVPCMPAGYDSNDLVWYLGSTDQVASIQRLNKETGAFETTAYHNGWPCGPPFEIVNGEAYIVHMKEAKDVAAPISAPVVLIASPADGETVSASPIDVTGSINDSTASVTVNGIPAAVVDGAFTAAGVPLSEGANTITATAVSANNLNGSHTITVTLEIGADYVISKGGSVNDSRSFQGDPALLDQAAYYTETQIGVPSFVTYATTGLSRVSPTDFQVNFTIQVSGTASEGVYEFQVEYGLLDGGSNPLEPLTNNVFSFKIQIVP